MKITEYLEERARLDKIIKDAQNEKDKIEVARYNEILASEFPFNKDKETKVKVVYESGYMKITQKEDEAYIGDYRLNPADGVMKYTFYKVKKDGTMSTVKHEISQSYSAPKVLSFTRID